MRRHHIEIFEHTHKRDRLGSYSRIIVADTGTIVLDDE